MIYSDLDFYYHMKDNNILCDPENTAFFDGTLHNFQIFSLLRENTDDNE